MVRWIRLHYELLALLVMLGSVRSESWHFTGDNIAKQKPTEQRPGTQTGFTFTPSSDLAVDGNRNLRFNSRSCIHTTGILNTTCYWSVDLSDTYYVKGIRIYHRNQDRDYLDNFKILGYPGETTLHDDATAVTKLARREIIDIPVPATQLSNITITRPADPNRAYVLILCEVEIYGGTSPKDDARSGQPAVKRENIPQVTKVLDFGRRGTVIEIAESCDLVLELNFCSLENTDDQLIWTVSYGFVDKERQLAVEESVIELSCPTYYTLSGAASVTCLSTESFNVSIPSCLESPCGAPSAISNGAYSGELKTQYSYYETLTWECSEGYGSAQNRTRQCLPTSAWTGSDPVCTLIECSYPSGLTNGELMYQNDTKYINGNVNGGIIITVSCDECFASNSETIHCTQNQTWSTTPHCTKVVCANLGTFTGVHYSYSNEAIQDNHVCGTVATVSCNTDFKKTFDNRTCGQDGSWSGNDAQPCERICSAPSTFDHGSYNDVLETDYSVGKTLVWDCSEGYKSDQNRTRQCLDTSAWSGDDPVCTLITCVFPSITSEVSLTFENGSAYINTSDSVQSKTTVEVNCAECFAFNVASITCGLGEEWDNVPTCSRIECNSLGSLFYTYKYMDGNVLNNTDRVYACNTVVEVNCGANYNQTADNLTCGEHGDSSWSGNTAPCVNLLTGPDTVTTSGPPIPIIGGAVAAVVVVGAVTGVLVFLLLRRRRAGRQKDPILANNNHVVFSDVQDGQDNPTANKYDPVSTAAAKDGDAGMYYSFGDEHVIPSRAIRVNDLAEVVLFTDSTEDGLMKEFKTFPEGMTKPHNDALQNRARNRYRDLYAYDDTRVVLDVWDPNTDTDYINACYIHGFNKPKAYIASQGPVKKILDDFWRMVWQTNNGGIVMLTNLNEAGKMKCDQYWPESGSVDYGPVRVSMENTDTFSNFVIRNLLVEKDGEQQRRVKQFHFTAWPDKDVPSFCSSLVHFRNKVKTSVAAGPIVVHCSAGIGRTGTFIAIDYLADQAEQVGYVDVVGCVASLREQRVDMVQKEIQYIFVHQSLVEILLLENSAVPTSNFASSYHNLMEPAADKRIMDRAFEMLWKLGPKQKEVNESANSPANDRYPSSHAEEEFMPSLSQPGRVCHGEYINAAFLPMYRDEDAMIITQTPLTSTMEDFWNLVYHQQVHTIIMMNNTTQIKTEEVYWPDNQQSLTYDDIGIYNEGVEQKRCHQVVQLLMTRAEEERQVHLMQYGKWADDASLPEDPKHMLSALEVVQENQRQTGNHPMLVHCTDGVERSGLFCVIAATLDRAKIEQDVAISQVIEEMRNRRPNVIPTVDQFQFCHEVVASFLQQFDTYSNFSFHV